MLKFNSLKQVGPKIEGVIFDWAGTTVDYGCLGPLKVIQNLFNSNGVRITKEEASRDMGLLKIDHLRKILQIPSIRDQFLSKSIQINESLIQSLYIDFELEMFRTIPSCSNVIPGVPEVMEYLKEREIKVGSTTGYTKMMLDVLSAIAKEQGYEPDARVAADEVQKGRPHPDMMLRNMQLLSLRNPSLILKVGDTISDIQEGQSINCWTAGILKGGNLLGLSQSDINAMSKEELQIQMDKTKSIFKHHKADFVIESINDVPKVVQEIEKRIADGQVKVSI